MAARVRPFGAADLAACLAIGNAVDPAHPVSLADARRRDELWATERYHLVRFVADVAGEASNAGDAGRRIVGWGQIAHAPWQFHPRKYDLRLEVDPAHRQRGVGSQLFQQLLDALLARDALLVRAVATESDAASSGFLTRRGFREIWRTLESRLDVDAFDPVPFAGAAERVERQGVTITTLAAELARDPDVLREVYDLHVVCNRSQQEIDPVTPPPFEAFAANEVDGPRAILEAWFLARDARAGHCFVGLSTLERLTGTADTAKGVADTADTAAVEGVEGMAGVLEAGYTAVHPAYRGRGIALALKRRTIAYARDHGYRFIETNSNAGNEPMLRINAALGFQPRPARISFERRLA
ncbi:MAG: GNAT family N-acetyltransferase [Chloroflexi bacterium]|nr:GNAT family N-acetyltransferase [Chloroflexota bacterium]